MMTRMPDRIAAVVEHLRASGVPFAVIGAAAMSTRGFPRQTLDLDILSTCDAAMPMIHSSVSFDFEIRKSTSSLAATDGSLTPSPERRR